jgi:hypothetical protein
LGTCCISWTDSVTNSILTYIVQWTNGKLYRLWCKNIFNGWKIWHIIKFSCFFCGKSF